MIRDAEHLFAYFMSTWVPSMEKRPFRSLAHFSIVLFFLIELPGLFACFGDEFLVSPFAKTFFSPPILKVLFLSFIVYPAAQMLLRLMKSHLLILLYYSKNESEKNWLRFISRHVLYMFLKSFIVSIRPFRSLLWRMFFCMGLSSVVNSSSFH